MGTINITDMDGQIHKLDAVDGWRVMEIIHAHGIELPAECGGACVCGMCHVHVAPDWIDQLHPANEDEEAKLDDIADVASNSRLSCQIIFDQSLDGIELILRPGQDAA